MDTDFVDNPFFYCSFVKATPELLFTAELIAAHADENQKTVYLIQAPIGVDTSDYEQARSALLVIPGNKIIVFGEEDNSGYFDLVTEDLAILSGRFGYKAEIGRLAKWSLDAFYQHSGPINGTNLAEVIKGSQAPAGAVARLCELVATLVIGSINDAERVGVIPPTTTLERVKKKIILYDADQTRFIFQTKKKRKVVIQGLSGTGKTELLLHRLKELYTSSGSPSVIVTCNSRVLARSLRERIPKMFDFLKVDQQIEWNKRLWCFHAWGSANDPDSGLYSKICEKYGFPHRRYSRGTTFDGICGELADALERTGLHLGHPVCDHIIVDESQDFGDNFFRLIEMVTKDTVYVAGDIFQGIFEDVFPDEIEPDYLLRKCYRTDPRTLIIAHAIGMGLLEEPPLRWLENAEWEHSGYTIEESGGRMELSRAPVRRFEDIDNELPVAVDYVPGGLEQIADHVVHSIESTLRDHPDASQDDFCVVILSHIPGLERLMAFLEPVLFDKLGWRTNLAHESKERVPGRLFVSNMNNVKGLEFPFVVCIAETLSSSQRFRNGIYMSLTRSFLESRLIVGEDFADGKVVMHYSNAIRRLEETSRISVLVPEVEEQKQIKTTFKQQKLQMSIYDAVALAIESYSGERPTDEDIKVVAAVLVRRGVSEHSERTLELAVEAARFAGIIS